MAKRKRKDEVRREDHEQRDDQVQRDDDARRDDDRARKLRERPVDGDRNPPYTTTGPITSPKFGSAGSGGLEYEPGPERD